MEAMGINGQLELTGNKIVIKRKGMMAKMTQGLKGDKEILVKQISSIQIKKAGALTNGYIQFSFSGGKENKGGLMDATKDENTIMFNKKQMADFEKIKQAIEEKIDQLSNPSVVNVNQLDAADQIKKLADLRDSGILTEDEFNAKKKQLLGI
ncbi:SHOCT domain-containing protein [Bacillus sp. ISL-35]|uniref:SHOCT domain-containing protein n=1 Tax=Bacillus sp. ISL-35 TaxID=2819122 RepID=UPI001BE6972A|nr:SHOCT domain-containing protein [Bacillus sp. ISL-35]MBT2680016.1 SHOCT domain-containing protein [Bacillus sp. ISL-35]MBT2703008.1 SHOCT domain-containing protein [Chryseobacterium sp. ISL-80]